MKVIGLAPARQRRGWSQAQLAAKANVSPSAIHRIESGRSHGTAPLLCKLADALEVTLDELLGRNPHTPGRAASPAKNGRRGPERKGR